MRRDTCADATGALLQRVSQYYADDAHPRGLREEALATRTTAAGTDLSRLLAGAIAAHFAIDPGKASPVLFPGSGSRLLSGLIRA